MKWLADFREWLRQQPADHDQADETRAHPLELDSERRALTSPLELRAAAAGTDSPGTLVGYAATYNSLSVPMPLPGRAGMFREQIAPGAFDGCLSNDVRCLRNHDDNLLLGRLSAGTLRLQSDERGLRYECDLPNTTAGRDTAEMIRRGDMTGCSFQFRVEPDGDSDDWDETTPGQPVRTIRRFAQLYDVGPVTQPAYESTRVSCRSLERAEAARAEAVAAVVKTAAALAQLTARQRLAEAFLPPPPPVPARS